MDECGTLSFDVNASDQDAEDVVTIAASGLKSWTSFNGTTFTANPGYEDSGAYSVTFTATDGKLSAGADVVITVNNVNRAPVITIGPIADPATINKNQTSTVSVTAGDADGDPLTYTWTTTSGSIIGSGASVTYKPADVAVTTAVTATVTVDDSKGGKISKGVIITVDATAPDKPTVTDDGTYTVSKTQLHASWTSSDPESGITEYKYAIGTAAGKTNITGGWISTGANKSVIKTGLRLTNGATYYFTVKAKNGAGLWSAAGNSNGIKVDAN